MNLGLIRTVVSEKTFEECGRRKDGRRSMPIL